jgi:hypothetical protein
MQILNGREPDWLLILLGAAVVLGLLALLGRYLPQFGEWWRKVIGVLPIISSRSKSDAEAAYRAALIAQLQTHHLGGTGAPLDEVFVAPRILVPQSGLVDDELLTSGPSNLHYLWPDLAAGIATAPPPSITLSDMLLHGRRTVISGAAGTGKTTLLAASAILCARNEVEERDTAPDRTLPIFFHLSELEARVAEQQAGTTWSPDPMMPLLSVLDRSGLNGKGLNEVLVNAANDGRLFLFIDGWDDLPGVGLGQTGSWLRDFLREYPETRVMMAAPVRGCGPLMRLGFVVSGLLSWRIGEAERLGQRWAGPTGVDEAPSVLDYWQPGRSSMFTWLLLRRRLHGLTLATRPDETRYSDLLRAHLEDIVKIERVANITPEMKPIVLDFWLAIAYRLIEEEAWQLPADVVQEQLQNVLTDRAVDGPKTEVAQVVGSLKSSSLFVVLVTWPGTVNNLSSRRI